MCLARHTNISLLLCVLIYKKSMWFNFVFLHPRFMLRMCGIASCLAKTYLKMLRASQRRSYHVRSYYVFLFTKIYVVQFSILIQPSFFSFLTLFFFIKAFRIFCCAS